MCFGLVSQRGGAAGVMLPTGFRVLDNCLNPVRREHPEDQGQLGLKEVLRFHAHVLKVWEIERADAPNPADVAARSRKANTHPATATRQVGDPDRTPKGGSADSTRPLRSVLGDDGPSRLGFPQQVVGDPWGWICRTVRSSAAGTRRPREGRTRA